VARKERKKRKKNNHKNSSHFVSQSRQLARALHSDQKVTTQNSSFRLSGTICTATLRPILKGLYLITKGQVSNISKIFSIIDKVFGFVFRSFFGITVPSLLWFGMN
jgi:hypothetical protein